MMSLSDKDVLTSKDLEEVLCRVSALAETEFDGIRDWDFHHYDFGTFTDNGCSVATFRRKLESNHTVDDTVIYYVLEAFNAISNPQIFRQYAEKAKALLDVVSNSY
jgi:hypothetical protein